MKTRIFLVGMALLAIMALNVQADTLFHWTFNGPAGEPIVSDTDIVGGRTVTVFVDQDGPDGTSIEYDADGAGALMKNINSSGPDDNDPGTGFFAQDTDDAFDLSIGTFTIEAIFTVNTLRQGVIIRKYGGGQYYIDIRGDGDVQFSINGDDNAAAAGPGALTAGQSHHVAAVFDENDMDPMKIYVDGQLMGVGPYNLPPADTTRGLGIGCIVRHNGETGNAGSTGQFFDGLIDEIRISDAALTPAEFIPEPATIAFLALGGLSLLRRKR